MTRQPAPSARRLFPGTHARERPDGAAVIFAPTGAVTTWQQLDARSNQVAHLLADLGLGRGDHVAIVSGNDPVVFDVMWAALRSGLYYTTVSPQLTPPELLQVVAASLATVVVASHRCAAVVSAALGSSPVAPHRFSFGGAVAPGWTSLEGVLAGRPDTPLAAEPEGAPLWFSSGTSGQPKGVVRPLPEVPGDPVAMQYAEVFGIGPETVHLSLGPLHHAAPIGFSTIVHRLGGTVVLTERFEAVEALALIERHRVTTSHMVPTMLLRLLKVPKATRDTFDVSSLQTVIHGAAPCPREVKRGIIDWWGPILHEYYGGTEGVGSTMISSEDWLSHPGSVGRAARGVIHIVGDEDLEVPVGDEGLVYFENPGSRTEYLGDPDQTAAISHPAGWQTLGDIGRLDADGYLYLTDRWTHKIVRGGVNVFPREIEDVLVSHAQVADAAVIGVPDVEMGEEVRAVVELLDPTQASDELAAELVSFCRGRLAPYKCPPAVDFATLPRQDNGKLYKRLLRQRYWAGQQARI